VANFEPKNQTKLTSNSNLTNPKQTDNKPTNKKHHPPPTTCTCKARPVAYDEWPKNNDKNVQHQKLFQQNNQQTKNKKTWREKKCGGPTHY
jgi:hypothetical protein